jgi:glycogen debranching enzyme
MAYYDTYIDNPLVKENRFIGMKYTPKPLPTLAESKALLPELFWQGHDSAIACYHKVWELAFANLRQPTPGNGFVSNYIDTAFNDHLFMWDSCFILLFCLYARRAFDFLGTLDNLYCKQHPDGFICREIDEGDGHDWYYRFNPSSTGPNLMPWVEWQYYKHTGDRERLQRVFPVLLAYYQWFAKNHTWQDGSYWNTGWGSGMDNQPRLPEDDNPMYGTGKMTWVDTSLWQILAARHLVKISQVVGREHEVAALQHEMAFLTDYVNTILWDEETAFYYDRFADGRLNMVKSIGAYWSLLAGVVPESRLSRFLAHLENPAEFARPHRVPTLSADHPRYLPGGGYWLGAVWAPTNYMVLRGLVKVGQEKLAHRIARNHLGNVVKVFEHTGTVWENYSPEMAQPGKPAKNDFVGWTGLPPVAVLLEYVFGLRANVHEKRLLWDVHLLEEHGVKLYAFGVDGTLDLRCRERKDETQEPEVTVQSDIPLDVEVRWAGGSKTIGIKPNA